jgi:chemotaxis protein methyltransferase CheR
MPDALKMMPILDEHAFQRLQTLLVNISGILLTANKRKLVANRLGKRLRHYHCDSFSEYLDLLEEPAQLNERRLVLDLLTTHETYFFREHTHFDFLGRWLRHQERPLRIWSAGCSSGEEAYSLAMVLSTHARHDDWSIFASDLSPSMLAKARQAIYDMAQAKYLPDGWLQRYCQSAFVAPNLCLRIRDELRSRVQFRELNLMQPLSADFGQFDVVFLRNVLTSFSQNEKPRIARRVIDQMPPGALLFIGHAENIYDLNLPVRLTHPSVYERL